MDRRAFLRAAVALMVCSPAATALSEAFPEKPRGLGKTQYLRIRWTGPVQRQTRAQAAVGAWVAASAAEMAAHREHFMTNTVRREYGLIGGTATLSRREAA